MSDTVSPYPQRLPRSGPVLPRSRARRPASEQPVDAIVALLMRRHPDGLTIGQLARLAGVAYESIRYVLYRLERRGLLLCEDDDGRLSIYED